MSFMLSYCSALDPSIYQVGTRVPSRMNASQKNGKQLLCLFQRSQLWKDYLYYITHTTVSLYIDHLT